MARAMAAQKARAGPASVIAPVNTQGKLSHVSGMVVGKGSLHSHVSIPQPLMPGASVHPLKRLRDFCSMPAPGASAATLSPLITIALASCRGTGQSWGAGGKARGEILTPLIRTQTTRAGCRACWRRTAGTARRCRRARR